MTNREALEAFTRVEVGVFGPGDFIIALPDVVNEKGDWLEKRVMYGGLTPEAQFTIPSEPRDEDFADFFAALKGKRLVVQDGDA